MAALFLSGRVVDLMLALTAAEAVFLLLRRRLSGRGPAPVDLTINLASGVCLMLAVRAALMGGSWVWLAVFLTGSGIAHGLYLARRWG